MIEDSALNPLVKELIYIHNNILGYNQYIAIGGRISNTMIFCFYKNDLNFSSMKNVYKYKILK